nr:MAG: wsv011-like protein [Metapenaeopsis lamellata majanivirus]
MIQKKVCRIRLQNEGENNAINDISYSNIDYKYLIQQIVNINNNDKLLRIEKHLNISKILWNPYCIQGLFLNLKNESFDNSIESYFNLLFSKLGLYSTQTSITVHIIWEKLSMLNGGIIDDIYREINNNPISLLKNTDLLENINKRKSRLHSILQQDKNKNDILQFILQIYNLSNLAHDTDLERSLQMGRSCWQSPKANEHHLSYLHHNMKIAYSHCGIGINEMKRSSYIYKDIVSDIIRKQFSLSETFSNVMWNTNSNINEYLDNKNVDSNKELQIEVGIAEPHLLYGEPEHVLAYNKLLQLRYNFDKRYDHNFIPNRDFFQKTFKIKNNKLIPRTAKDIIFYNDFCSNLILGYRWVDHIHFQNSSDVHKKVLYSTFDFLFNKKEKYQLPILHDICDIYKKIVDKLQLCIFDIYKELAPRLYTSYYTNKKVDNKEVNRLANIMADLFIFRLIDAVHNKKCDNINKSIYSVTIDSPLYLSNNPSFQYDSNDPYDLLVSLPEHTLNTLEFTLNENQKGARLCIYFDADLSYPTSMMCITPHENSSENFANKESTIMAAFSAEGIRGITSSVIDTVSSVARRFHAGTEEIAKGIKTEQNFLAHTGEYKTYEKEICNALNTIDDDTFIIKHGNNSETFQAFSKTGKSVAEEISAIRKNEKTMSSLLDDMGAEVPTSINEPCALEIIETYPDYTISKIEKEASVIEKNLPAEDLNLFQDIEKSPEFRTNDKFTQTSLKKSKTINFLNSSLGKKLGNGVSTLLGRFGKIVIYGGVSIGTVALLTSSTIHASRGAHFNIISKYTPSGIKSYKLLKYSCSDKELGNGYSIEHPFESQISQYIKHNSSELSTGAYVENPLTKWQSKTKGYAPICCSDDKKAHGSCSGWAIFSDTSVLGALVSEGDLPKGSSLTCDVGTGIVGAVSDLVISSATDVSKKIVDGVIDVSSEAGDRLILKMIQSPTFILGIPLIMGLIYGLKKKSPLMFLFVFIFLFVIFLLIKIFLLKYIGYSPANRKAATTDITINNNNNNNNSNNNNNIKNKIN